VRIRGWLWSLALAGCALTRNAPPREVSYFSPEPAPAVVVSRIALAQPDAPRLRLGRIERGDHLRYRIVRRWSDVELRLYERRRWTERPDEYVRRALLDGLFGSGRLAQDVTGSGPMLDVELIAFEEVLEPRHLGRVHLRYVLHDQRVVLARGEACAERPVAGDDFATVVRAIGGAMTDATDTMAAAVVIALTAPPAQTLRSSPPHAQAPHLQPTSSREGTIPRPRAATVEQGSSR
jgi:cholesterol transport system auxiliary component